MLNIFNEGISERTRKTSTQENLTLTWKTTERVEGTINLTMRESEVASSEERVVTAGSQQIEGKPLVLLQVNCRRTERKLTMLKYSGTITQPSEKIGVLKGVECSFVLKTTSIAGSYGWMRILR
jgi:uncharacterized Fe-S cluster-containing protein